MTDKTKSLRVRRLHDLHEQWCTLSRDVIELGSSIGCVLASAHESIRPGPLGDDVDPIMGMSGRDIREYLICSHIGHAEEENGHYELSASRDPIPFLHIYNEFEIIPRDSLSIPVRYYSAEKSRVSVVDAYYWLPEDRFRYWEYFIFSKLNRFNFRTIGMRFVNFQECQRSNTAAKVRYLIGYSPSPKRGSSMRTRYSADLCFVNQVLIYPNCLPRIIAH